MLWTMEAGDGFKNIVIYNKKNQPILCTLIICMDINQHRWVSGKC